MPIPMLANPAADSEALCPTCQSKLLRTGKPATFSDGKAKPEKWGRPYKGWIPALLVDICPTCDVRVGTDSVSVEPVAAAAAEPVVERESYLERVARENGGAS